MEYNGYLIKVNDYRNSKHKNCDFIFHNLNDCDEPIGTGESIADCKKQINEIIFERVHLDNFKKWKSNNGWSFIHPLKIYQHKNKEIYKTDQELYEMYVEQYTE